MHVAQVEHGLGAVLLLRRQPVVDDRRLVVHVGAVAVEVVVAQFDSRYGVTWKLKKKEECLAFRTAVTVEMLRASDESSAVN